MQREINSPMDYKHLPVSDIYLYVFRHMSIGVLENSFSKNMEKISRKKFALTFLLIKKDSSTEFFSDAFLKIFRIQKSCCIEHLMVNSSYHYLKLLQMLQIPRLREISGATKMFFSQRFPQQLFCYSQRSLRNLFEKVHFTAKVGCQINEPQSHLI